jgi:hypothetical protein
VFFHSFPVSQCQITNPRLSGDIHQVKCFSGRKIFSQHVPSPRN